MMTCIYKLVTIVLIGSLLGCSGLPAEKGIPMDSVFNSTGSGLTAGTELDILRKGIRSDFTKLGNAPVLPLVRPMSLMPIWMPQRKLSSTTLGGGQWLYESVDDGGLIDP
jgi:hypothetical protein